MNPSPSAGSRSPWFDVPCCPPNLARLLASLAAYQATESDTGVQLHQLTASEIRTSGLSLTVASGYPWTGDITIVVDAADEKPCELSVRIPAWASGAMWERGSGSRRVEPGYASETRVWHPGDEVRLRLPMTPRWTWPDQRIDAVRGCVAVERGPLVYCAESVDQKDLSTLSVDVSAGLADTVAPDLGDGAVAVAVAVLGHVEILADPSWPYCDKPTSPVTTSAAAVTLIPYHLWANRGPASMRVFLPARAE